MLRSSVSLLLVAAGLCAACAKPTTDPAHLAKVTLFSAVVREYDSTAEAEVAFERVREMLVVDPPAMERALEEYSLATPMENRKWQVPKKGEECFVAFLCFAVDNGSRAALGILGALPLRRRDGTMMSLNAALSNIEGQASYESAFEALRAGLVCDAKAEVFAVEK